MAKPTFLLNNLGQSVISLVKADGTMLYPIAVGQVANPYDEDGAWLGVASHIEGATPTGGDGLVTVGAHDTVTDVLRRLRSDTNGRLLVDRESRRVKIIQNPTVSTTPAYSTKDAIGALLTFAGAGRTGILSGLLETVVVVDKSQQMPQCDLVLFSATFTAPTDNAVFAPSDSELLTCVAVIPIVTADWKDFSTNSIATVRVQQPYVLAGTAMYGALVSRGTPTFVATNDIQVMITVRTD